MVPDGARSAVRDVIGVTAPLLHSIDAQCPAPPDDPARLHAGVDADQQRHARGGLRPGRDESHRKQGDGHAGGDRLRGRRCRLGDAGGGVHEPLRPARGLYAGFDRRHVRRGAGLVCNGSEEPAAAVPGHLRGRSVQRVRRQPALCRGRRGRRIQALVQGARHLAGAGGRHRRWCRRAGSGEVVPHLAAVAVFGHLSDPGRIRAAVAAAGAAAAAADPSGVDGGGPGASAGRDPAAAGLLGGDRDRLAGLRHHEPADGRHTAGDGGLQPSVRVGCPGDRMACHRHVRARPVHRASDRALRHPSRHRHGLPADAGLRRALRSAAST
jgi:hypothetical protein